MRYGNLIGVAVFFYSLSAGTALAADTFENLLVNPGAEDRTNNWDCQFSTINSWRNLFPHSGNKFFTVDYAAYCTQVVNIDDYTTLIDSGSAEIVAGLWVASPFEDCLDSHTFTVSLSYFDDVGNRLSDIDTNPEMPIASHVWKKVELLDMIPSRTRSIKFFTEVHERCLNDSFAFDDAFLFIKSSQNSRTISLDAPQEPVTVNPQDNVTIRWTTTNVPDGDTIIISMKRDAVDALETIPDDLNWYRFTSHGAENVNDGSEVVTIPNGLVESGDWRFYVGLNNDEEIWDSSETFNYRDDSYSFNLTVNKTGSGNGIITSTDNQINCGATCSANFNNGTSVTLNAVANSGSVFTGWSGGGCSGTGNCAVTMDKAQTVTATFNVLVNYTLSITKVGNGTVTSSPAGINCGSNCSAKFTKGKVVTLTAKPATGATFVKWTGCIGSTTNAKTCTVTLTNNKTVTATFTTPAAVDLQITNAVLTPVSPAANSNFIAKITVKNNSTVIANGGYLDVWAHQPTVQTCGAQADWMSIGNLAAGESKTLTLTLRSKGVGNKTLRAFVDSWCQATESNESNNQFTKSYTVK